MVGVVSSSVVNKQVRIRFFPRQFHSCDTVLHGHNRYAGGDMSTMKGAKGAKVLMRSYPSMSQDPDYVERTWFVNPSPPLQKPESVWCSCPPQSDRLTCFESTVDPKPTNDHLILRPLPHALACRSTHRNRLRVAIEQIQRHESGKDSGLSFEVLWPGAHRCLVEATAWPKHPRACHGEPRRAPMKNHVLEVPAPLNGCRTARMPSHQPHCADVLEPHGGRTTHTLTPFRCVCRAIL